MALGLVAHCGLVFFHPWDLHPVLVSYLEIWDSLTSMGVLSPFLGLSFPYCTPHSLPPGWPWDGSAGEACLSPAAVMARMRGHYTGDTMVDSAFWELENQAVGLLGHWLSAKGTTVWLFFGYLLQH